MSLEDVHVPDREPEPRPSKGWVPRKAIIGIVVAVVLVQIMIVFCGGGFGIIRKLTRNPAARQAEIAKENDDNRREVATAFLDPQPPSPEEAAEFVAFLDRMGRSLDRGDVNAVGACFNTDRLYEELEHLGAMDGLGGMVSRPQNLREFREVGAGLGKGLVQNIFVRWDSVKIQRIRRSTDERQVVVIAVHRNKDPLLGELAFRMRWWFITNSDGWKLYDFEDLEGGLRASRSVHAVMTFPAFRRNPAMFLGLNQDLQDARAAVQKQDAAGLRNALKGWNPDQLPQPHVAIYHVFHAWADAIDLKWEDVLGHCDQAERINPDMPMLSMLRAPAYYWLGRHEDCLATTRKYKSQLGIDALNAMWEGTALEKLGQPEAAAACFRESLGEDKNAIDSLHGLRRVLPPEKKDELIERLEKVDDPKTAYEEVFKGAREDFDQPSLAALVKGFRKHFPNAPTGMIEEIRLKVRTDEFDAARAVLEHGLKVADKDDRLTIRNAYLFAMVGKNRAEEAYAAMPAAERTGAFRILADDLQGFDDDGDLAAFTPQHARILRQLIEMHRKHDPNDAWLWYHEGALRFAEKDYVGAEMLYGEGNAKLPADAPQHDRDMFRRRRVDCYVQQGKALEAYPNFEPADDTFTQLAWHFHGGNDLKGLKALLDAHTANHPKDVHLIHWRGQWHFSRKEYAEAARHYQQFIREAPKEDSLLYWSRDSLIRSLLRSGQAAKAPQLLKDWESVTMDRHPVHVPLALKAAVAAANNNLVEVERLFEEQKKLWTTDIFYHDEDFNRETARDMFDSLRLTYPPPKKVPMKPDT